MVRPMSATSIISILNEFNVKNVGVLEEKVIEVGKDEVNKYFSSAHFSCFVHYSILQIQRKVF